MAPKSPMLLVTDLDGTLLDHHNYQWQAAEPALALAKSHEIPIIFNSSKTLAECRLIQWQLNLQGPIIFENGAGVALPRSIWPETGPSHLDQSFADEFWVKALAVDYAQITEVLQRLRHKHSFRFRGFGDMSVTEISEHTGLSQQGAANAKRREFSEPLIWQDTDRRFAEFTHALQPEGLTQARSGRFIQIMGPADKGTAMLWLADRYSAPRPRLLALGDSDNDIPMLSNADLAVIVRSPAHDLPVFQESQQPSRVMVTDECGPLGWNRAVLKILEETEM